MHAWMLSISAVNHPLCQFATAIDIGMFHYGILFCVSFNFLSYLSDLLI